MSTIDSVLNDIMTLDFTSREILLDILTKRQIEARRAQIAKDAKVSLQDYENGKTPPIAADEAIEYLEKL